MSNNTVKQEVLIKQYLRLILDISGRPRFRGIKKSFTVCISLFLFAIIYWVIQLYFL